MIKGKNMVCLGNDSISRVVGVWLTLLICTGLITPAVSIAATDFTTRCADPNVILCFGFDSQSEAAPYIEQGQQPSVVPCFGDVCTKVVTDESASGAGSLRFEIPSQAPPDSSGSFHMNFTPGTTNYGNGPYPIQFGEGDEFFVQWRQKFSQDFLRTFQTTAGSGGFKQAIIGEGDRPGTPAYSCTQLEIVTNNNSQYGVPQMYHSCGGKDFSYEALYENDPQLGYLIQNVPPCRWRNGSPDANDGSCIPFVADEWMTFQVRIKIGTWYKNDRVYNRDSAVELWVGRDGQASVPVLSFTQYDIANSNPDAKYGKVWLTPFHTGKDGGEAHPTAYTWYDELIVSKTKIDDPVGSSASGFDIPDNTWKRVAAPDVRPTTGGDLRFVHDPVNNELIMFGGDQICGATSYCRTTWTYNVPLNKWTLRNDDNPPTSFPAGRCQPGMAFDSDRNQTLMFSGCVSRPLGEYSWGNLWHYDLPTGQWADYGGSGPAGSLNTCNAKRRLLYDPNIQKGVLLIPSVDNNMGIWEFDPDNPQTGWVRKNLTGAPFPENEMYVPVVYDSKRGNYIFTTAFNADGNGDPNPFYPGNVLYQTWIYNPAANTFTRSKSAQHPNPGGGTHGHEIVYDSANDVVLYYGGNCKSELWVYKIQEDKWEQLNPAGDIPPGHDYFAMAYDSVDNVMVVWGSGVNCIGSNKEDPSPVYLYRYGPGAPTVNDPAPRPATNVQAN